MIRVAPRTRMGLVQMGQGGSAFNYTFDASGLSNDPQLPLYMQSLTPAQLQTALNGGDPLPGLIDVTNQLVSGSGLPCGTTASGDPTCAGGAGSGFNLPNLSGIPFWVWLAGGGVLAFSLLRK